jgi:hypothetical protein
MLCYRVTRLHETQKTGIGGEKRWFELLEIVRRHSPPAVVSYYEYLARNGYARWWLNKRMRIFQRLYRWSLKIAGSVADLLSSPFWSLPAAIHKEVLWQISGIR